MPRIVGEFDADRLHERIDAVAPADASLSGYGVVTAVQEFEGLDKYTNIEDIAQIHWKRFFYPSSFISYTIDGQVNHLDELHNHSGNSLVDEWHADDLASNRLFTLPEVLTTASRWPTSFLVGNIALRLGQTSQNSADFWSTEAGNETIDRALAKGDAHEHRFKAGQVVVAPSGTLHKRNIPIGTTGYRYFMRHFPHIAMLHSATPVSRLRIFR